MTVPTGVPLEPADVYPRSVTKLRSAVTPDVPQLPVEHRANVAGHGTSLVLGFDRFWKRFGPAAEHVCRFAPEAFVCLVLAERALL